MARTPRSSLWNAVLLIGLACAAAPAAALDLVGPLDASVIGMDDYGFETNNGAGNQLILNGGQDELFQMFGYLGSATGGARIDAGSGYFQTINGGIRNTGATTMQSDIQLTAAGATAYGFNGAIQGGSATALSITYAYDLIDVATPDGDHLAWSVSYENHTDQAMTFSFYTYLDLDLNGTFANDRAFMRAPFTHAMIIEDQVDPTVNFIWNNLGAFPDHYQIGAYPSIRGTLDSMTSSVNLTDGPPLGSTFNGDFTAAFQYDITISAGQTFTLIQAIPEPGTTMLLLTGLFGLAGFPLAAVPRR
jgi:hypothetical protein